MRGPATDWIFSERKSVMMTKCALIATWKPRPPIACCFFASSTISACCGGPSRASPWHSGQFAQFGKGQHLRSWHIEHAMPHEAACRLRKQSMRGLCQHMSFHDSGGFLFGWPPLTAAGHGSGSAGAAFGQRR